MLNNLFLAIQFGVFIIVCSLELENEILLRSKYDLLNQMSFVMRFRQTIKCNDLKL